MAKAKLKEPPSVEARKFFCDTLTFDETNLELVAKRFGTNHMMVGSDYPFGVMEDPPGEVLLKSPFAESVKDDMRAKNYRRLAAFATSEGSARP
jgi:hypothetical protein